MRRPILVATIAVFTVAAAGAASWYVLRPHDQLAEARQLMAQGDVHAAQLVLRRLLQQEPNQAEAHRRLGQVQLRLGDPTAAEKELRAARALGADANAIRPLLASAVVAQGRDAEALRDYTPDGLAPEQAAAVLLARADAQLALRQPDDAAASIAQAKELTPKSVEVILAAARLARIRDDRAVAEAQADAALAIDPNALDALMLQGELRAARGDQQGALASDTAALQRATSSGATPQGLGTIRIAHAGLLIGLNEDQPARTDIDAVLKENPRDPMGLYLSAWLFARAHEWKAADAALLAVGTVLPLLPRSDTLLALVKANVGQPEQAIEAAQRQVARAPADLEALKLLARLQLTQQRPDKAAEVLAKAAAAGHSDAETLKAMAQIYASTGKPQQALTAIQQASALAPEDVSVLSRMAALQLRLGNSGEATQTLTRALELTPVRAEPIPPAMLTAPSATAPDLSAPAASAPAQAAPAQAASGQAGSGQAAPTAAQTATALVLTALQAGEIDRAAAALDRLREANGDPEQIAMLSGLVKMEQIDLPGARAAFEEAMRLDPGSVQARLKLARVLALQGDTGAAAALLEAAAAADPGNAAVLGQLVDLRLAEHQTDKAIAAAEAAQAAKPEDTGLQFGLAELYTRAGQPAKALTLLDNLAKTADPKQPPTQPLVVARVRALLALGQLQAAAASMRGLLDRTPDDVSLRSQLALLLARTKDFEGARTVLREGLARRAGDTTLQATAISVTALESGPDAALARATQLADDPANELAVRQLQGDLLMSERKYGAAVTAYQGLLKSVASRSLQSESLVLRLAGAMANNGDPVHATAMLRDWLSTHPDSPATALQLSEMDLAAHRLPDAEKHLQTVLASQPNNSAALNNMAWVSQQTGDLPRAHELALRSYLLQPSPQAADTLGWVMLAQDNPAPALALLRDAARRLPNDAGVQYHLAAALARNGQKDAAHGVLQTLLATAPGKAAVFDDRAAAEQLLRQTASP